MKYPVLSEVVTSFVAWKLLRNNDKNIMATAWNIWSDEWLQLDRRIRILSTLHPLSGLNQSEIPRCPTERQTNVLAL
jgi:hypothetical protein